MNIVEKITNYLKAGYPCLVIRTTEERRAQGDVLKAAKTTGRKVATWSASEGTIHLDSGQAEQDTGDLVQALRSFREQAAEDTIYLLRDIHQWPFDFDPILPRLLRDLITEAPDRGSNVIVIAPEFKPYSAIEKLVTIMDYSLPDEKDLKEICKTIAANVEGKKVKTDVNESIIKAMTGLSTTEAENALALSIIEVGAFSAEVIYREKVAAVKRTELLEIIEPDKLGLDGIGGLENLKNWVLKRVKAYSPEATKYGLPAPKGCLIAGVPGSGKSLSAKAIGTALGIPTLRLDIGQLFQGVVGTSEQRTRDALKLAEAISPCVLFVDEVDKGLSGAKGSGENDSGVTRRVFGTILSWMQDKKKPVFLVFTANQVSSLPPEFLRKGRFDELFAVDLPHQIEREQISAVVLKRVNRDPKKFDLTKIAEATKDFTGSEIESVVTEALFAAFDLDREVETADIVAASKITIPLSKTMAEEIDAIRKWGETRAKPASIPPEQQKQATGRKIKI